MTLLAAAGLEHGCVDAWFSSRECYELRTYGYSPVLRDAGDHSEGAYILVDADGECDCECHFDDDDTDDGCGAAHS